MNNNDIVLLKYIKNNCNKNLQWSFKYDTYKTVSMSEKDFLTSLNELQTMGYISYRLKDVNGTIKNGGTVTALRPLLTYEEEKRAKFFSGLFDFIKFIIPVIISIIALIISLLR